MDVVSFKCTDRTLSKFLEIEYLDETQIQKASLSIKVFTVSFNRL